MAHRTNSRKKKVCFCLESVFSILCCHISVYKIWCSANYTLEKQVSGAWALPWHVVKDNSVGKCQASWVKVILLFLVLYWGTVFGIWTQKALWWQVRNKMDLCVTFHPCPDFRYVSKFILQYLQRYVFIEK